MQNSGNKFLHIVFIILLGLTLMPFAEAQQLWSEVKFNKASVYVGEPMEITVSVFTSTWFTAGVDPGNIKVNGAYSVFFRNVSTSRQQNGKTFAGVDMIFNVIPYGNDNVVFPELKIEVESPADGDYKGKPHVVKTKAREINVRPIPPGFDVRQWLVTNGLSVQQYWSGDLKKVKVGDVVTRTITRNASNTVSQLIPAVAWDSLSGVSEYPARSDVENHRSSTAISATRTETIRYLFEKEGEVVLPEMEFTWWNPYHKKLYKRTLAEVKIDVLPNPDLGMLASIRDSLQAQQIIDVTTGVETEKPFTILGLSVKQFIVLVISAVFFCIVFFRFLKWAIASRKKYLKKYHNSEQYYWNKFMHATQTGNNETIVQNLYLWIDHLKLQEPTATHFAQQYGDERLQEQVAKIEHALIKKEAIVIQKKSWESAHQRYLSKKPLVPESAWINP